MAVDEQAQRDPPSKRRYTSPLRVRQAQQTRDLILNALIGLLDGRRSDEVSTQDIAQAAGVSQRTVYRHFPDREALLAGLGDRLKSLLEPALLATEPDNYDELKAMAIALMAGLDEFHIEARAEALFNADPRRFADNTRAHSVQFEVVIGRAVPELSPRDRLRLAAVMRCLLSSQAWLRMREEYGVPGVESGPMVAWVLDAILHEIQRENPPPPVRRRRHIEPRSS